MLFPARILIVATLAFAPALLTFTLTGCATDAGDDDDDDDDDDDGAGDAEALADAAVDYLNRCGIGFTDPDSFAAEAEPILVNALFGDFEDSFRAALLAQFESENVIINGARVGACIAAIEAAECNVQDLPDNEACEEAVQGTLVEGDVCAFDTECGAAGLSCFIANGDDCGTCEQDALGGETCADRECADGLVCDGIECVVDEGDEPLFAVGDACDPEGDECELFDTGLACADNGAGNECVPAVIVQVGETCNPTSQERYCENTSSLNFCVDDGTGTDTGTCDARPGAGETCLLGVLCDATTSVCDDGTCELGGDAGATCDPELALACQVGLQCDDADNTCAPLLSPTEPPTCE